MFVNMKVDIEMTMAKPKKRPAQKFYDNLEETIKDALGAERVEIIDIDFYDEDNEELEIDW